MNGIAYPYRGSNHSGSHQYLFPTVNSLLANIPKDATVLDMGCGNGSFLSLFAQNGWKLHGTDLSSSGIEMAKKHFPEINFFLADSQSNLESIQRQIGTADVILSTEVIEHVYNPRAFLKTAFDLLKPNGKLVITTPYHGYCKNVVLSISGKMDRHFTVLWDHGHIKFWSRKTLTLALEETGFKVEQFHGSGRVPYLWKSMVIMARKPALQV